PSKCAGLLQRSSAMSSSSQTPRPLEFARSRPIRSRTRADPMPRAPPVWYSQNRVGDTAASSERRAFPSELTTLCLVGRLRCWSVFFLGRHALLRDWRRLGAHCFPEEPTARFRIPLEAAT